jgi:hypothetical protein
MNHAAMWGGTIFRCLLWSGYFGISLFLLFNAEFNDECMMDESLIMVIISYVPNVCLSLSRSLRPDNFESDVWYIIIVGIQIVGVLGTACYIIGLIIVYKVKGILVAVSRDCHNFGYFAIIYCVLESLCIIMFEFVIPYIIRLRTGYTFIDGKAHNNESGVEVIPKHQSCTICLSDYETDDDVIILKCEHIFHRKCIQRWTLNHNTCPYCRDDTRG